MTFVSLQGKEVVARKPHSCEWCAETIEAGEKCRYRVYRFQEQLHSAWMHPECYDAMHGLTRDELQDGWCPGDFKRGSIDQR